MVGHTDTARARRTRVFRAESLWMMSEPADNQAVEGLSSESRNDEVVGSIVREEVERIVVSASDFHLD